MKTKLFSLLLAVMASANLLFADSGTCGENLTWDLTDSVLTISGSGAMTNFSYNSAPWYSSRQSIKSILLPDALIAIGNYSFYSCTGLTSVTIPESVTSIGSSAFSSCTGLTSIEWNAINCSDFSSSSNAPFYNIRSKITSFTFGDDVQHIPAYLCDGMNKLNTITIPNSVTSIGDGAFWYCSSLTSVTIPNSVTSIGNSAFYGCTGLTSVTIPNSVTSIGSIAFYRVLNIIYNGTATGSPWGARGVNGYVDGYLVYSDATKTALLACSTSAQGEIIIPNSVTSIGDRAFYGCSGLTSVTIPNSVTSIGSNAFYNCSGLTSVTVPNSVTSIGNSAFDGCSGLTSVEWNAINCHSFTLTSAPFFNIRSQITSFTLCDAVEHIPAYLCYGMNKLNAVTIPNSVTSIGESAFHNCSGLTSVVIPNAVTSIGGSAFYGCSGLTSVHISDLAAWCAISFGGNTANPLYYAHNLYLNDGLITDLVIHDTVTTIGSYAFYGCSKLTSVTIPNSVTSIGGSAFYGCSGLTSVHISDLAAWCAISFGGNTANPLYYAHNLYLNDGLITDLVIPNNVTSIGDRAFYGCSGLTSVTIPDTVTTIGSYAFSGCTGLTSVTIPNSVTTIGSNAFSGCTGLTSVTIPNSVTSIGESAFEGCTGLTSVTIPNNVTSIGSQAFYNCSGLISVTIGNSVATIGNYAFYGCSGLTSVEWNAINCADFSSSSYAPFYNIRSQITSFTFGDAVEHIPAYLCYGNKLNTITIPNSVTSIGNYAFYGCSGLTSVTIPNSVTSIGSSAFSGCTGLTSVTIPNSVTSIGSSAFYNVPNVVYSGSATGSPWGAKSVNGYVDGYLVYSDDTKTTLLGCSSAAQGEIIIPNSVTSIGSRAFYGCSGLTSMTIPNSVTSIGDDAFYGCTGLTSIEWNLINCSDFSSSSNAPFYNIRSQITSFTFGDAVEHIPAYLCYGNKLNTITIPNSVTSIGDRAFSGCSGLTSVTIPNSVTSIGEGAFIWCSGLTSVTIGNSVTSIGEYAFNGCSSLTSVTIGNSVTSIGDRAFYNCTGLTSVTIPSSVTSIGSSAFSGCTGLTSVTIPNSVTSIGESAFEGCTGLTSVTIPNNVTSIGSQAFYNCSGLISVTIGNSVATIGNYAFYGCSELATITNYAVTPQTIYSSVFANVIKSTCMLYVPEESVDLYIEANVWKDFANIVAIDDSPTDIENINDEQTNSKTSNNECTKVLRDGQIFILRGEKVYTLQGQEVR